MPAGQTGGVDRAKQTPSPMQAHDNPLNRKFLFANNCQMFKKLQFLLTKIQAVWYHEITKTEVNEK